MNSPQVSSPVLQSFSPTSRSRSSTKLADDITSLTSFNPFSEEDENDQSSYTLVTSLFSRVKNTFSAPLTSAVAAASNSTTSNPNTNNNNVTTTNEPKRPPFTAQTQSSSSRHSAGERPNSLSTVNAPNPAPPLVSLTPVHSEVPTYSVEYERSPSRNGMFYSESPPDGGNFGNTIPGFPIPDDARSIKTSTGSLHRSGSVSKVIRRIRGEGLSRDYWMDDDNCKECYDCKSVFTTWRRKHHCRICGQIFCSRCASNIIKGSRFGHEGMVRVCNLCVEKLAKVDDDDDDDHRSVISSVNFPAHQFGPDFLNLGHHSQSPFAASQLFGRDEPFNLYSIAETKRPISGSDDSGFSRPHTPFNFFQDRHEPVWEREADNPAPFRRALSDDEKDIANLPSTFADDSPTGPGSKTPIDFPIMKPANGDGMSSIQFPTGSPEHGPDSAWPSELRSRFNSYADFEAATPFIRSRVQSRLDNIISGEPGWRTRRESTAYAQELNLTSMLHLKVMLRQMLSSENIPNVQEWEDTLLRLALRIARELTFTSLPHRQGEDMDVRRYVKIKKVPGGTPQDSEYVDGAVITKNVAHKQMSRDQKNPRVMLVTFPLEFFRVEGQYMHFGQIVRQEKEYLGNLAARIAALRPHVILVEKSVSRIALESLLNCHIAVARTVRPSAIQLIARMTQADVFSSMDKLALEPRLGHCARFRVQTFDHPLILGRRKTFMRFEGCSRDMGCTIILRGENIETLRRIKKVTRFLTFIVRNLKLETHLWKDSVITLPSFNADAIPATPGRLSVSTAFSGVPTYPSSLSTPSLMTAYSEIPPPAVIALRAQSIASDEIAEDDLPDEEAQFLKLSRRINQSLEPYLRTFISVSATLRFPPPYPIRRMKELDEELIAAKRAWEDEIVNREERSSKHTRDETITTASQLTITVEQPECDPQMAGVGVEDNCDIKAQIEALPEITFPSSLSLPPTPYRTEEGNSYFSITNDSSSTVTTPQAYGTPGIRSLDEPLHLKTIEDISGESNYGLVKWKHEEFRRIWEWYLRKSADDFIVEKYQCLSVLGYTVPIAGFGEHRACFPPRLNYFTFYGENDCTLGQYIEKSVADTLTEFLDPKAICTGKGCDQPLARHCKVYVHGETRLFVAIEQWDGQIIGRAFAFPAPDMITTWSACRVCGSATPFIPVSEEMQRYSFAKFLELHFYPADVKLVQGAGCQHNIYQHHVRYFAFKGMTVRFQTDPIVLHEVVYPPFRIHIRPEVQLEMKNHDYRRLRDRNLQWYSGLVDDLKLISIDAATGDEKHDAALLSSINALIIRAEAERADVDKLINQVYKESAPTDTLVLNKVRSYRQDKIVGWQQDFDKLPKPKLLQNADRNSKRASTFGSVRAMWPRRYDFPSDQSHLPSSSVSEAEEGPFNMRRVTGESFISSASDASEPEPDTEVKRPDPEPITEKPPTESPEEIRRPHDGSGSEPPSEKESKSEGDSDSTIEAIQGVVTQEGPSQKVVRASRLPRRTANQTTVAELVKKYQDFLPAQGVQELAKTAFPPHLLMSESDQEYSSPLQHRHASRTKGRHHRAVVQRGSTSDFEQGYAASIAPRYLTNSRRSVGQAANNNRIVAPSSRIATENSRGSSRRPSPEKKPFGGKGKEKRPSRPPSPPNLKLTASNPVPKTPKVRLASRQGDRTPARPPVTPGSKSAFRRPPASAGGKVSNIAKHFERLGRDAERSRSRYNVIRGRRARPVGSAKAVVEILDSVKDAIMDESESSDSSSEADDEGGDDERKTVPELVNETKSSEVAGPSEPAAAEDTVEHPPELLKSHQEPGAIVVPSETIDAPSVPLPRLPLPPSPFLGPSKPEQSDADIPTGTERHSILRALSGFWLQPLPNSRNTLESDDLMIDPEHIFRDSSMVVRTDEPTSIIALALNSPQYREMLARSRAEKRTAREARLAEGEAFMPDDRSVAESTSTWGVVNVDPAEAANPTEDLKVPSSKLPWAITFESGGLTISCTVLYPEQFDALRRTYNCERSMIESLSRCVKWNTSGGKSGSAFLKTGDDRFIAKELSKPELQTMETFAPAYFDYMSSSVSSSRPTLLAKVFGCYKLTFRKAENEHGPGRAKSTQMNLLVMENLFYDRRFSKIYDLKGSTRNRHVQSTGRENEVLLDENLVQTAHLTPFYLREHSKRILRGALYNDSKFLADINVMDYSLVCGVDSQNNELVVGIVDFIRTYTWDKKLESWVKESAFMGGSRGEPTIISPKQYRQRFISAMERYFPLVPDRWMKQKDTPEEDPNSLAELWPDW